ncbi:MAG: RNA-binding cell elongation regulator Jag/EloR, partial [Candidatus Margulisiibacteriota bacterium]
MNKIKMNGKDVNEAVESAAKVLGKSKDEVQYRVIREGKPGMLGVFGGEEAEIEAWAKTTPGENAKEALQEIINKLGLLAIVELKAEEEEAASLNIKGEDLGQIIGKEGATLMALQVLVSSIVSRTFEKKMRVYVDAGGYRERQEQAIERLAIEAAKDVEKSGLEKVLPPMSAADRRIVHLCL